MKSLSLLCAGAFALMVGAVGCADGDAVADYEIGVQNGEAVKAQAPMLNLSHIECTADGKVLAHFVLLFAGSGTPGTLSGTYNGGTFGPTAADKNSGNVWHYNVLLPSGYINILSATTTTSAGAAVSLHNPEEYAGDYQCGGGVQECPVKVTAEPVYCTDKPLTNPGAECANFGLVPQGKDDNLSGLTFAATQDAYVAIVKSGNHGCGPGNSAYRIYVNVTAGQLLSTPVDQGISHVTYCACPK